MKKSLLTGINALIAFLLTLLGFGSCERPYLKYGLPYPVSEYGCPYASFEAAGKVTDKDAQPVENIRVRVKGIRGDEYFPEQYTDEAGEYVVTSYIFPLDSVDVIVTDTAGVYEGDSVRVKVEYDRSKVAKGDHWNNGKGIVRHDFQLKKK